MAQTITIRIDNGPEGSGGRTTGVASAGGLPIPVYSAMAYGADQSAMVVPAPLFTGAQAAQSDIAVPAPSLDFLVGGNAVFDVPTPFSGGVAGVGPESGGSMNIPTPMDSMVPGAQDDQPTIPSPDLLPNGRTSGQPPAGEGTSRKARK